MKKNMDKKVQESKLSKKGLVEAPLCRPDLVVWQEVYEYIFQDTSPGISQTASWIQEFFRDQTKCSAGLLLHDDPPLLHTLP